MLALSCLDIQLLDDFKFSLWECFASFLNSIKLVRISGSNSRTKSLTLVHEDSAVKFTAELAPIGLVKVRVAPIRLAAIISAAVKPVVLSTIVERSEAILKPVEQLAISFD